VTTVDLSAIDAFKAKQREGWAYFAPLETITTPPAARLVRFAGIKAGQRVLDVGCGTGVVALTAAIKGAKVTGLDLTPELLARARENTAATGMQVDWHEGDVEQLPFADGEFDVVISQFGHMFAPRPEVAIAQMLRVLKNGGTIAFSTWPPEVSVGRMFALVGRYAPPPPPGVSSPPQWGDPNIVRERLGDKVKDLRFARDTMVIAALNARAHRLNFEHTSGPVRKLVESLEQSDPAKLEAFRREYEALVTEELEDNQIKQSYLMTRAIKV